MNLGLCVSVIGSYMKDLRTTDNKLRGPVSVSVFAERCRTILQIRNKDVEHNREIVTKI